MRSRQTPFLPGGAKECNELDKGWKTAVLLEYLGATVDGKWKLRKLEPVDDVGNAPNVYGIKMYKVYTVIVICTILMFLYVCIHMIYAHRPALQVKSMVEKLQELKSRK